MGSGKSTLSRILTEKLGWPGISTDARIELKEGRKIADIFKDAGETYFRNVEHQVVLEVAAERGVIVDCGGGVVLNSANMEALKKTGTVIYLSCTPEEIFRRVNLQPKRPLLDVPDPLAKTVVRSADAWWANYARHPAIRLLPILGFAGALQPPARVQAPAR